MPRTASQLLVRYRGKRLVWTVGNIDVYVTCHDAQVAYGRERLLIAPEAGTGSKWVGAEAIREPSRDEQAQDGGADSDPHSQPRAAGL